MQTIGKVVKLNNNIATVNVIRKGACGENCAACNSCKNSSVEVMAYCDIYVQIGDMVTLESDSKYVYLGLFMLFILPILLPVFSYIIFSQLGVYIGVVFALVFLVIALISVYTLSKSKIFQSKSMPKIINVVNN